MHRYFTYDRMVHIEAGSGAEALVNIPLTLSLFDTHFPRFPVLPGVLIMGCASNMACDYMEYVSEGKWRCLSMNNVKFRHYVQPGNEMRLKLKPGKNAREDYADFSLQVHCGDRRVATIQNIGVSRREVMS